MYNILMIDDYLEQIEQMRQAFEKLPTIETFHGANHAQDALDKLKQQHYDLILMDQQWTSSTIELNQLVDKTGQLPAQSRPDRDLQGFAIMRYLRQHNIDLPIIFASSVANEQIALEAIQAGATTYYAKTDLLQQPEFSLYYLEEWAADLNYIQQLLLKFGMEADSLAKRWLASQRSRWNRRWPTIVQSCLQTLAKYGYIHLSTAELHQLQQKYLPTILQQHKESINPNDLLILLQPHFKDCQQPYHCQPFWFVQSNDQLLVILEPDASHPSRQDIPVNWSQLQTQWQILPNILPLNLQTISLGPNAPYWGRQRLLVGVINQQNTTHWNFSATQPSAQQPFPLLAGRLGSLSEKVWQQAITTSEQWENILDDIFSAAALYSFNHKTQQISLIPFPKRLVNEQSYTQYHRHSQQQLIYLHQGIINPELSAKNRQLALSQLPKVEVWRSGWAYPFEEETLKIVLDNITQYASGQCVVWLATDFLHVRSGRLLKYWAREFDLVILAPQGICILECKASTKESDLKGGHIQVKIARELVWEKRDGHKSSAGIMLKNVLLSRINRLKGNYKLPNDLLFVTPKPLRNKLQSKTVSQAKSIIENYYKELENIYINPSAELAEHFITAKNRNKIPAVISFVVAPKSLTFNQDNTAKSSQVFILSKDKDLPNRLKRWLTLPAVFSDKQYQTVYNGLRHLSYGAERNSMQSYSGFTPLQAEPNLGSWRVISGHAAWSNEYKQTLLSYPLSHHNANLRRYYSHWLITTLHPLSCEMRWLDIRGLPAEHIRELRQLVIVIQGQLIPFEQLKSRSFIIRLQAITKLFTLACDITIAQILGIGQTEPIPLIQQRLPEQPWDYGWLAGDSPKSSFKLDTDSHVRQGLQRIIPILSTLITQPQDPLEQLANTLLQHCAQQLADQRQPMPNLQQLQQSLQAIGQQVATLTGQ